MLNELYEKGIHYFSQQQFELGLSCIKQASKQNYLPAIKELGLCYLHGIGLESNLAKAIKYFKQAKKNPEAQYELCKLYYFGYGVQKSRKKAEKLLKKAVKNNFSPALNLMAVHYQLAGKVKKAEKLLSQSFYNNNRFAIYLYSIKQLNIRDSQLKFVKKFRWAQLKKSKKRTYLHKKPDIFLIKNLLSKLECEYIKFTAAPYMRPSMTVDPKTGKHVKDTIRTSFSATIDWLTEDPAINQIMHKCCLNFNTTGQQSEILHVLHYSIGQEYKPHYDFFGGISSKNNFKPEQQRIKTICLYLNDVKQGGHTSFPKLDKTVAAHMGNVVFFENIDNITKKPYSESLHAGTPVIEGEKWLATLWIHDNDTNRGPNYESI